MNSLLIRLVLAFSAGFHIISSIVWLYLKEGEKAMFRADMAIIFVALYFILKKLDKNV